MTWHVQFEMNDKLFLRDPESSELGKKILLQGAQLMREIGYDAFTFKKLAMRISTNESSIYRYFENKHRLLVYMLAWYWRGMEYRIVFNTRNMTDVQQKLQVVLDSLLLKNDESFTDNIGFDIRLLHEIVIKESSKAFLTDHVTEDNNAKLFRPYKDLCALIAQVFLEINPAYVYPRSLASTVIEMAHYQHYFMHHLPSLTDFGHPTSNEPLMGYLKHLTESALKK